MTNIHSSRSTSAASIFKKRYPSGSPPEFHNLLPAANLRQSTSPLPTQKTEKGSAAHARSRLSALRFPLWTFDPDALPNFPSKCPPKIHNPLPAANLRQTKEPASLQKSEKG